MKMHLLLAVILLLTLALTACSQPVSAPPETEPLRQAESAAVELPQFAKPTFLLAELPQLTPYEPPREIVSRYYSEEFVDMLQPADDYGRLLPYIGKLYGEYWWQSSAFYGLADERGKIVVDPVYRHAYFTEPEQNGGQTYLVLSYPIAQDDATVQELARVSDGFIQRGRYMVAAVDGSWVSDILYGDDISVSENRIIINTYTGQGDNFWDSSSQSYSIYDMQGQLIASGNGRLDSFYNGYAEVQESVDNIHKYYWINTQGEYVAAPETRIRTDNIYQNPYIIYEQGYDISYYNPNNKGVKDKDGNIIVTAAFNNISLPSEEGATVAVATSVTSSEIETIKYWLIDLLSGKEQLIGDENIISGYPYIYSNNWCVVDYSDGVALIKGDQNYRFYVVSDNYADASWIKDELFALNYVEYDVHDIGSWRTDIFDTTTGQVIASLPGYRFSNVLNDDLIIMDLPDYMHTQAFNLDFTPAFNGALIGNPLCGIRLVRDDIYSVQTDWFSGLIRENGEWLLRVNIINVD